MNKYCVIARNVKTYFIKRLTEEVGKDLLFYNPWSVDRLPPTSVYFFRSSSVYGDEKDLRALSSVSPEARVINPPSSLHDFRDKFRQYSQGLERPFQSIPWMNLQGVDYSQGEKFVQRYKECIVKPHRGQQGWGVEKITGSTLLNWWEGRSDDEYLMQKFVSGEEIRLFFIRDEFFLMRRSNEGGPVNFALGGQAEIAPLPTGLREKAKIFIQNSGAFYGAIDLIHAEGKYYFLELNLSPGIEQIEKVTGENIIQKLIQAIESVV